MKIQKYIKSFLVSICMIITMQTYTSVVPNALLDPTLREQLQQQTTNLQRKLQNSKSAAAKSAPLMEDQRKNDDERPEQEQRQAPSTTTNRSITTMGTEASRKFDDEPVLEIPSSKPELRYTLNLSTNYIGQYQPIKSKEIELADTISQQNNIKRGAISNYIIFKTLDLNPTDYGSINRLAKLPLDEDQIDELRLKNLPLNIQSIFNFDATLGRLPIIIRSNNSKVFARNPLPGIRLYKATALNTYQYLIDQIQNAPKGNINAINALQGFVTVLMELYEMEYNRDYSSFQARPHSENNKILEAVVKEAQQLAKLAEKHDPQIAQDLEYQIKTHDNRWQRYTSWLPSMNRYTAFKGLALAATVAGSAYGGAQYAQS